jgi:hypothetical protein
MLTDVVREEGEKVSKQREGDERRARGLNVCVNTCGHTEKEKGRGVRNTRRKTHPGQSPDECVFAYYGFGRRRYGFRSRTGVGKRYIGRHGGFVELG